MVSTQHGSFLVKDGLVFDPIPKSFRKRDVLVRDGKICQVGEGIPAAGGEAIFQAAGKLVLPGLIDFHVHCFRCGMALGIDADDLAPRAGTTTFVDAGSSGSLNFPAFREYVITPATARILAFLNISAIGLQTSGASGIDFAENDDDRLLDVPSAVEVIQKNPEFMALGLPLEEALVKSTYAPALKLRWERECGTLSEGSDADIGIFELRDGTFDFSDTYGNSLRASRRLVPLTTFRKGVMLPVSSRETMRYDFVAK